MAVSGGVGKGKKSSKKKRASSAREDPAYSGEYGAPPRTKKKGGAMDEAAMKRCMKTKTHAECMKQMGMGTP